MVLSAIWEKHACTSEFFRDYQNCTSPKDEYYLKSLKYLPVVFHKAVLIIYMRNYSVTCEIDNLNINRE